MQYCSNDAWENANFVERKDRPKSYDEGYWNATLAWCEGRRTYYPGKLAAHALGRPIRVLCERGEAFYAKNRSSGPPAESPLGTAEALRMGLEHFADDLAPLRIFVIEMSPRYAPASIIDDFAQELEGSETLQSCCSGEAVNLSGVLDNSDEFVLDEQIRASGHVKIAQLLAQKIAEGEAVR